MSEKSSLEASDIDTAIPYTVDEDGAFTAQAPGFEGKRVINDKGEKGDKGEKKAEKKAEAVLAKLNHERTVLAKSKPLDGSTEKVDWPDGSFGAVQKEWFEKWSDKKSPRYRGQMESRINTDILPKLGHRHIMDIEAPDRKHGKGDR